MSHKSLGSFPLPSDRNNLRTAEGTRMRKSSWSGLRSIGLLARLPVIGLVMFLLGGLLFGAVAYNVQTHGPLLQWDNLAKSWRADEINIPVFLIEYTIFGFFVSKELVITLSILLVLYFLHKRFWRELSMLVGGVGGGGLIWSFVSQYIQRPPTGNQMPKIPLTESAFFPSGHTLLAILFYGLLAYLVIPKISSIFWKWTVAILLAVIIFIAGIYPLLLGDDYLTDVIAGYALGFAWAGIIFTLSEIIFRDRSTLTNVQNDFSTAGSGALHSPDLFRQKPWLGIFLLLVGGAVFAAIGYALLTNNPLLQVDNTLYQNSLAVAKQASPTVDELMLYGFFLGKEVLQLLVAVLAGYLLYQRAWREFWMLIISSPGGSLVWRYVNVYFNRPRPPEQLGLVITNPSFPSGHVMSALICYGLLAYLLIPKMPSNFWKWFTALTALVLMLFVGFSRVYEGSHYLSDVIGGYALGLTWASLVYTLIENLYRNRSKDVKKR